MLNSYGFDVFLWKIKFTSENIPRNSHDCKQQNFQTISEHSDRSCVCVYVCFNGSMWLLYRHICLKEIYCSIFLPTIVARGKIENVSTGRCGSQKWRIQMEEWICWLKINLLWKFTHFKEWVSVNDDCSEGHWIMNHVFQLARLYWRQISYNFSRFRWNCWTLKIYLAIAKKNYLIKICLWFRWNSNKIIPTDTEWDRCGLWSELECGSAHIKTD